MWNLFEKTEKIKLKPFYEEFGVKFRPFLEEDPVSGNADDSNENFEMLQARIESPERFSNEIHAPTQQFLRKRREKSFEQHLNASH